jgi:uncharacterized protein (TIGR02231 family)
MNAVMPNRIATLACALILPCCLARAEETAPVPPPAPAEEPTAISAVTVYEGRALVSRLAEADLPEGASIVRLSGFPPALSEVSLRAAVEGEGVKVVSVTSRTRQRSEAVSETVRAAEKELDDLSRQRGRLAAQRAVADQEAAQLGAFQALAGQAIAEGVTMGGKETDVYHKITELFTARREKLDEERRQIDKDLDALQPKLNDARANLEKISSRGMKTLRSVEVALEAARAGKAKIAVSYIIRDSGWSPRYEARLTGGKLAVAYQGDVHQKTGEDWKGVHMALSTARPALGAARPELPYLMMATVKTEKRRGAASNLEAIDKLISGGGGAPALPAPTTTETVAAAAEDTGLSVLFQVPGVADVPSDNRAHKVPVTNFVDEQPALAYETVPKLAPCVYLRCDTANRTVFPMLAGPVDLWRESGFIGTSTLKFAAPQGKLALSLGIDENLKVRRVTEDNSTREAGLLSGERVRLRRYKIEVSNYRADAQTVRVRENYPVSDVDEVKVALTERTTPPKENDEKLGLLTWELPLKPGETKSLWVEYEVRMPKDFAWNE